MTRIDFPARVRPYRAPPIRDRLGWFGPPIGRAKDPLPFFRFHGPRFGGPGTHNPLVVGSNPTRPTNSIAINGLWPRDRGTAVPWCMGWKSLGARLGLSTPSRPRPLCPRPPLPRRRHLWLAAGDSRARHTCSPSRPERITEGCSGGLSGSVVQRRVRRVRV